MKKTLLIVFGKSGTGKDTAVRKFVGSEQGKNFSELVRYTTRPIREGEVNGVDYHFISEDDLDGEENSFLEGHWFNNWFYGTSEESITQLPDGVNAIMSSSIEGYEVLKKHFEDSDVNVLGVHLYVEPKVFVERYINRVPEPDVKNMCIRFLDELKQYEGKEDAGDISFNANCPIEELLEKITRFLQEKGVEL